MHISVTVLNTDIVYVFYVRRSVYRSTGLHGQKADDGDDELLSVKHVLTECTSYGWTWHQYYFFTGIKKSLIIYTAKLY